MKADGFPFLSIYDHPYPTFKPNLHILLLDVPVSLLIVDGMFRFFILNHNYMGLS